MMQEDFNWLTEEIRKQENRMQYSLAILNS